MLRYAIRQILVFIPTLLAMTAVTFIIMELTPGSPFDLANSNGINPETIATLEKRDGIGAARAFEIAARREINQQSSAWGRLGATTH